MKKTRWLLVVYDVIIYALISIFFLSINKGEKSITKYYIYALYLFLFLLSRFLFQIYNQIWRYGGIQNYIKLTISDVVAFICYILLFPLFKTEKITHFELLSLFSVNLISSLSIRMIYRYCYKCGDTQSKKGRFLLFLLRLFAGMKQTTKEEKRRINVAIYGAGNLGLALLGDIRQNKETEYEVRCFIDIDNNKVGRKIEGIEVIAEDSSTIERLKQDYNVQEIFFSIHNMDRKKMQNQYERFVSFGFKVKNYDIPHVQDSNGKPSLKDFEIEDLLFRKPILVLDDKTSLYYKNKTVLITGGGGSIGSELSKQICRMEPKSVIVLDIYENCAYDLEQEIKFRYKDSVDFHVEICSITNYDALERVFAKYKPDIVINAAAHKHVPLMENNVIEAIENNIFGCKNLLDLTEKYNVSRFMMVSTDKAVNPTNVMGATKRMCEMMVLSRSQYSNTVYSCTRFGNVLGSAGSVIPLFKKQIAQGGPVTITDKRIIRYFMTIPEASQLVLTSGAMSKNGELFVLDMGSPVKILDLAESMIRLTGAKDIRIVETGLRPGEKLYEELLIKTEGLDKTENNLIFIERDNPFTKEEIENKLQILHSAIATHDDDKARIALHSVVPSYKKPEEINE